MMTGNPSSTYCASDGAACERFLGRWSQRLAGPFCRFRASAGGWPRTRCRVRYREPGPHLGRARSKRTGCGHRHCSSLHRLRAVAAGRRSHRFRRRGCQRAALLRPEVHGGSGPALARNASGRAPGRRGRRGGLVFQRLFWDAAAELDAATGAARDKLFSSPLALPEGLPLLWRETGLTAVEHGSITIRMDFADFADYWEPLLGGQGPVGSYVAGLSPERRPLIEERVRAAFLCGAPDGLRSLTATAWAVCGVVP
jgi:hypothetical protein